MPSTIYFAAAAGAGRFIAPVPTLSYAGSGTSNNGKFTITNYNSSFTYTASAGTVAAGVLTVTNPTSSCTLTAKSPKGLSASSAVTAYRQAAVLINVEFIQCYDPCGDCTGSTWTCGCGSGCNDSGGGAWGECICRGPGYSYYQNFGPTYTWSGSDYTNGSGEWWRIV